MYNNSAAMKTENKTDISPECESPMPSNPIDKEVDVVSGFEEEEHKFSTVIGQEDFLQDSV